MANYRVEIREQSFWQPPVEDKDLTAPPVSPSEGDRYIIASGAFSWDLLDEDCADISDWTDYDLINGVSSQVTFDSKSCFKFDSNTADTDNRAARYRDDITKPANYTLEFNLYCDAIGGTNWDHLRVQIKNNISHLWFRIRSDGLFVLASGNVWNEVGTDLVVQDTWQIWRFEVTGGNAATATVDVYLDDILKASNVDCDVVGTGQRFEIHLDGATVNDQITYIDYIKIGTGLKTEQDAWQANTSKIAQYISSSWSFYTPQEGWFTWVKDEDKLYKYNGSSWAEFAGGLANIVEDLTPQLGGDLDMNGHSIGGNTEAQIDDAVAKKHTVNADTDLDATFEATFVKKVDTVNVLSDITSTGANIEDAVTKKHTQNTDTSLGAQSADLNMNTHKITGVVNPVSDQDAATKKYVDDTVIPSSDFTRNTLNIIQNAFNIAVEGSYSKYNMVDSAIDAFVDETGIDTVNSLNEDYDSVNDLYEPTSTALIELDYMEYANDALAQAAYVSSHTENLIKYLDEDCAGIDDWADGDIGDAVSSQVTFDSKSCFKLDGVGPASQYAVRTRNIGSFTDNIVVFSAKLYFDYIGSMAESGYFNFYIQLTSTKRLDLYCATDGIFYYYDGSTHEIGTDLIVQDTWQEWKFVINRTANTFEAYLGGVSKGSGNLYTAAGTEGDIALRQMGNTNANQITYTDYVKVGYSGVLQSYSESTIKEQGTYSLKGVAAITDSLNDTLTRTVSPIIDLSNVNTLVFDARASRTGTNFEIQIHDSGGTTTTKTVNIASADTFQEVSFDISAVTNANKDAIDQIIIKITNADAANTIYIDDFKSVGLTNNMTLISNATEAESNPSNIRIIINETDTDAITINTHYKAYASRDNGANWVQATLSDEGDFGSERILTGVADVSAQATDKTIKWKITTLSNKDCKTNKVGLVWD